MFGLFGKKANQVKDSVQKSINRDQLEATIAGAILLAFADGELEDSELQALSATIENNEKLSHFGSEIGQTIDRFVNIMKAGATLGRVKVMKEIRDCKADEEAKIEIFATLIDIAQADGEIEPEEVEVLKMIGRELGVSLSMFGIEG